MTLPDERYRALLYQRSFLCDLTVPGVTPGVPRCYRLRALHILRHAPGPYDLERLAAACPELLSIKPSWPKSLNENLNTAQTGGTMRRDDERCHWCCEPMTEVYAEGRHERQELVTLVCSADCLAAAAPWYAERAANKIPVDAWTLNRMDGQ